MFSRYRKFIVIGVGATLLAALTAGPLSAASSNKTFTAAVNPSTMSYSSTGTAQSSFTITYTNTTPSASINSVTLTAPTGWTIDSPATGVTVTEGGGSAGNYNVSIANQTITVTNLSPVGYLGTVSVTFLATANWSSTLTCSTNSATWTITAWTGSNLGGNQFTLTNGPITTSIGSDLAVGASVTVSGATLTNVGTVCVPVTISRNGNSVTVLKPTVSGEAFKLDILWDPEPAALPLPVDQVTSTAGSSNPIQWCNGTTSSLSVPTSQVSCLVSESAQVYGPDTSTPPVQQVQVHDVVFLLGDYSIVRG